MITRSSDRHLGLEARSKFFKIILDAEWCVEIIDNYKNNIEKEKCLIFIGEKVDAIDLFFKFFDFRASNSPNSENISDTLQLISSKRYDDIPTANLNQFRDLIREVRSELTRDQNKDLERLRSHY